MVADKWSTKAALAGLAKTLDDFAKAMLQLGYPLDGGWRQVNYGITLVSFLIGCQFGGMETFKWNFFN